MRLRGRNGRPAGETAPGTHVIRTAPPAGSTSSVMTNMDIFMERFAVKHTNGDMRQAPPASRDVTGLEAMLDYAIVEGAQMRLPLFVSLLRLARMALKEECEELRERRRENLS
jgi:hypothetical protein